MEFNGSVRKTRQRETILETLRSVKSHPTADELFMMVREKMPHVSLATVYRNLEMMAEEGIIRKVSSGEREMRFDGDISRHYHMRCTSCGRPYDLPFNPGITLDGLCPDANEYGITDVNVEFKFVCGSCGGSTYQRSESSGTSSAEPEGVSA